MDESQSGASRFGVDLKSASPVVKENEPDKIDRAKASVYTWDDPRLQKTAVVTKRLTKAATSVQRFIRACISHWKYYNEERIPLLEELEDCKRRQAEELVEVENFKQRGFEEAKFELEFELAMPQEEFEKSQKISKDLKQEIKEEEEAIAQLEKEMADEKQYAKKLGREKHEIEAQHTLSRLDVEIPALEAEKLELEGVDEEFGEIVRELKGQLKDMNGQIYLEERHKKRLIRCLARMIKELEARGAKAKVINAVKLSIKYKGEDPPPKPPPAPSPAPEPEPEAAPPTPQAEVDNDTPPDNVKPSKVSSDDDSGGPSEGDEGGSSSRQDDSAKSGKSEALMRTATGTDLRSVKRNRNTEGPPAFNWGDKEMVRRASLNVSQLKRRESRSLSPVRKDKKREKEKNNGSGERKGRSRLPRRAKSADMEDIAVNVRGRKKNQNDNEASFNWSAMAEENEKKLKKSTSKDKSDKDKSKKKKKESEESSEKKGKRSSVNVGKDGHFSWAFHAAKTS